MVPNIKKRVPLLEGPKPDTTPTIIVKRSSTLSKN